MNKNNANGSDQENTNNFQNSAYYEIQNQIRSNFLNLHGNGVLPQIVAISKGQSPEKMIDLYEKHHQLVFGENYVQEAEKKRLQLCHLPLVWHFTGRIQKNKLKFIVGKYQLIHSVSDDKELEMISKIAHEKNLIQSVLLQVNLSKESSKGGFSEENLSSVISKLDQYPHVKVQGLMTMPPIFQDHLEAVRPFFSQLRTLLIRFNREFHCDLFDLSMGTSSDYKIAVQEGATLIRLGTIIFGKRNKYNDV